MSEITPDSPQMDKLNSPELVGELNQNRDVKLSRDQYFKVSWKKTDVFFDVINRANRFSASARMGEPTVSLPSDGVSTVDDPNE